MAREFRPVDRDAVMLLPPDLREWLPPDHLAWLVLEVVEQLDLSGIESGYRLGGTGRQAYDPAMLTALLVYAYCQGIRSSRVIERACVTDVACRVIAAQQRPDHTTIARFRADHAAALAELFGQVLAICGRAGLGRVGVVAVDGTKIAADASRHRTHDEERLRKLAGGHSRRGGPGGRRRGRRARHGSGWRRAAAVAEAWVVASAECEGGAGVDRSREAGPRRR